MSNRPEHFKVYEQQFTEIVPGVFVTTGDAVYIVDDEGEVATWNADEWAEDPQAVSASINACILAAVRGAAAVRDNLVREGVVLEGLIQETFDNLNPIDVAGNIPAKAWSDDKTVEVEFNAVRYFADSEDAILCKLYEDGWERGYQADDVAHYMAEFDPKVKKLFDYLAFEPKQLDGDTVGFECSVDESSALAWIKEHRPALFKMIEEAEKDNE